MVDGYTKEQLERQGTVCPNESHRIQKRNVFGILQPTFEIPKGINGTNDASVPWHMQVELQDPKEKNGIWTKQNALMS